MWRPATRCSPRWRCRPTPGRRSAGFGIHPVSAGRGAARDGGGRRSRRQTMLPFSWQGVCLHAAGASRVRVTDRAGGQWARCRSSWPTGGLAGVVGAGVGGPAGIGAAAVAAVAAPRRRGRLFEVAWSPVGAGAQRLGDGVVVWEPAGPTVRCGLGVYRRHEALATLQSWLAGEGPGVLVVLTRGAVGLAGRGRHGSGGRGGVGVWCVRRRPSIPGRVVLVDSDGSIDVGVR